MDLGGLQGKTIGLRQLSTLFITKIEITGM